MKYSTEYGEKIHKTSHRSVFVVPKKRLGGKRMIDVSDMERETLIQALKSLECYENDGYTIEQLKRKLTVTRALEVEIKSPHADWW